MREPEVTNLSLGVIEPTPISLAPISVLQEAVAGNNTFEDSRDASFSNDIVKRLAAIFLKEREL